MPPPSPDSRFVVLLPVKPAAVAKSRLLGLGDRARRDLVAAFAGDTASAALGSAAVAGLLAVTDDVEIARMLTRLGAQVVPDGTEDLNRALLQASAESGRHWPDLEVVALCADLPALRATELDDALTGAPSDQASFVTDAEGSGTTMLAAPSQDLFRPRFGTQSRQAHLDSGAREVDGRGLAGLRRDVDTPEDLRAALALGVGTQTSAVTARLRL